MVGLIAATFFADQGNLRDRIVSRMQEYDLCPFETVTTDLGAIERFVKKLTKELTTIEFARRDALYEQIFHPRHTRAYQNLIGFVDWKYPADEKIPIKTRVILNEAKFNAAQVDEDGNTYLNRLMLSHFFVSELDAMVFVQELAARKQLSMQPNKFGQTPLMLAAEAGWWRISDRILRLGASRTAKDSQGRDAISYMAFARPEINFGEIAQREVFTVEHIADQLYKLSNDADKKRIFKVMNDWLANPRRLTCGNYPEGSFNLKWPTPRGKKKPEPKIREIFPVEPRITYWPPPKSQWDPRKSGGW